jgi:polyhydroxybutyrate depolymerase
MRVLVLLATVAVLGACTQSSSDPDEGDVRSPTTAEPAPSGTGSTTVDGRRVDLLVPEDGGTGAAVIVLHGATSSPERVTARGGWAEAVETRGFVAAVPEGYGTTWNAGACCGVAERDQVDDVAFIGEVVAMLAARPDIEPDRIYVVGHSNGGMLVYRLACESEAKLAGFGVVAGTRLVDCPEPRHEQMVHVHGSDDVTVPYEGSSETVRGFLTLPRFPSVETSLAPFVVSCRPSVTLTIGAATATRWDGCPDGASVELVLIADAPHAWPRDPVDATDTMLDAFGI